MNTQELIENPTHEFIKGQAEYCAGRTAPVSFTAIQGYRYAAALAEAIAEGHDIGNTKAGFIDGCEFLRETEDPCPAYAAGYRYANQVVHPCALDSPLVMGYAGAVLDKEDRKSIRGDLHTLGRSIRDARDALVEGVQTPTDEAGPQDELTSTLAERGERYGVFSGHAGIAQGLKQVMRDTDNWGALSSDKKEALEMIAHKIARILNGDPDYVDSWHDIAGYSKLIEDAIEGGA